jgi:hypothetical protein
MLNYMGSPLAHLIPRPPWLGAVLIGALVALGGCARPAYVLLHVTAQPDVKPIYQLLLSADIDGRSAQFFQPTQVGAALALPVSLSLELPAGVSGHLELLVSGLDAAGSGVAYGNTSIDVASGNVVDAVALLTVHAQPCGSLGAACCGGKLCQTGTCQGGVCAMANVQPPGDMAFPPLVPPDFAMERDAAMALPLTCDNAAMMTCTCGIGMSCVGTCGSSCTTTCRTGSICKATLGSGSSGTCETSANCTFTVGTGGSITCNVNSSCDVTCLGACMVTCNQTTMCRVKCGGSTFMIGSGTFNC